MKKKILGAIAAIAIAAMVTVNVNFNADVDELSALTMSNIEALASGESGGGKKCYSVITKAPDDNSLALSVTDCSDCMVYWATSASSSSTCS